jgi:ribulose kinase
MKSTSETVIGVDVGSGSVRAGIFDLNGRLLSHATQKITTLHRSGSRVEQSSPQIWQAVCHCIREALAHSGASAQSVAGIGFDATCSLVVLDKDADPLAVSPDGEAENNIIVWMDHRATEQSVHFFENSTI